MKKRIKITEGTIVHGVGDARPGTILKVDHRIARALFIAGKAVPCADAPKKPATRKKATPKTKAKK